MIKKKNKIIFISFVSFIFFPLNGFSVERERMKQDEVVAFYQELKEELIKKHPEFIPFMTPIYCIAEHCRFDIEIPVVNLVLIKGYIKGFQNAKNNYKLINIELKTVPNLFPEKYRKNLELFYLYKKEYELEYYYLGEESKEEAFNKLNTIVN